MTKRTPHGTKPKHCEAKNKQKTERHINKDFLEVPQLGNFIKIPNLKPGFGRSECCPEMFHFKQPR